MNDGSDICLFWIEENNLRKGRPGEGEPHTVLHTAAVQLWELGLCPVPMREKSPALSDWKKYQTARPSLADLEKWFIRGKGTKGKVTGVGIVTGEVSGGTVVRDFDSEESYLTWKAARADLSQLLPTVRTGRGYHVYFRTDAPQKSRPGRSPAEGDLLGEGRVATAPPSLHASGRQYAWVNPLPSMMEDLPSIDDVEGAGLMVGQRHQRTPDAISVNTGESEVESIPVVEKIIASTLPPAPGTRNQYIFKLIRRLQGIPAFRDKPWGLAKVELRPIVREWHKQALPTISTKCFDITWEDVCHAWDKVKVPIGEGDIVEIFHAALKRPSHPSAQNYDSPLSHQLIALCVELQRRAGKEPFYLTTRAAAALCNEDRKTIGRRLKTFANDGLLEEVQKGRLGRATRWRWLPK